MNIRTKTTLAGVIAVVTSVVIATFAAMYLVRAELTRQAYAHQDLKMRVFHNLITQQGEPRVVDGKLLFGNYVVNGNYDLVDRLTTIVGGTATIFLGDTRISTNVMKDDGTRAVGTPLVGVAKDAVINRAQSYRGDAEILGVPYFTSYDPLVDRDGRTYAVLYVGVKQSEFMHSFHQLVLVSSFVAVGLSIVVALLVSYLAGRLLGRLASLAKAADAVSTGERLDVPMVEGGKDEIGELSSSIDRLRESMREAMKRLESM